MAEMAEGVSRKKRNSCEISTYYETDLFHTDKFTHEDSSDCRDQWRTSEDSKFASLVSDSLLENASVTNDYGGSVR